MVVVTQDMHCRIQFDEISKTVIERKSEGTWLVTATLKHDTRAPVLGRYPSEAEAISADTHMYLEAMLESAIFYEFPISSVVAPEERIDDRQSKRHGAS